MHDKEYKSQILVEVMVGCSIFGSGFGKLRAARFSRLPLASFQAQASSTQPLWIRPLTASFGLD
jgi:hypothetical protein